MHTSAVLNTQESLEWQSVSFSVSLSCSVFLSFPFPYIFFFLVGAFLTLILYLKHTEGTSFGRTARQTDSTLFTQFICHSNEATVDLTRSSSISPLKRSSGPKGAASKSLLLSTLCPNFYKLPCVPVCLFVWYLHWCQQVHLWIQIPWFAWAHPQQSTRQECLQSPKQDMNRCCFIFTGSSASSREAADCLTSHRT